jgi:uncharacterized OsmC-like protein
MATVSVVLLGGGECVVDHPRSGARLVTSKAPEYGGLGRSFSSTDLLAAALGTCIATDLEIVAARNGVPPETISLEVVKLLSAKPKRVQGFDVHVRLSRHVDAAIMRKLHRAAGACLVQRALAPSVHCRILFEVETRSNPGPGPGGDPRV